VSSPTRFTTVASPIDALMVTADDEGVTGVFCLPHTGRAQPQPDWVRDDVGLTPVTDQLAAYFAGELQDFDVPLAPRGTPFQTEVWAALRAIPYGTTTTYGALATQLGKPLGASRAIGACNGRNPISVLVPCHRVIGADGNVIGYAGGLDRKRWLLAHERRHAGGTLF
jgi:methylated-DNA-[protein]-cysteine S-methyltransferase